MPTRRRVLSPRFIAFALTPALALLLSAEGAARLKYFFAHGRDWAYILTPIPYGRPANADLLTFVKSNATALPPPDPKVDLTPTVATAEAPEPRVAPSPAVPATSTPGTVAAPTPDVNAARSANRTIPTQTDAVPAPAHAAPMASSVEVTGDERRGVPAAPEQQLVFKWQKPCVDQMVFSVELQKEMPRTWDENCFRGDRVERQKGANEYRLMFVGGSTVEDAQSDAEMMTAQVKRVLPPAYRGKRIVVVNAGKAGFDSGRILLYFASTLRDFSPDLIVYYEAWNEQPTDVTWLRADERVSAISNPVHRVLYHRSMLYTYLVEKFAFATAANARFWKIDVKRLKNNFKALVDEVRNRHIRFVFVTQVVRFPRVWKGVDTFDYRAVDALLERLKADPQYEYDATEVSALNQRLAVGYTVQLCRENNVPVIDILGAVEALGDAGRHEMFSDLGHLTPKGDRIVGELVGARFRLLD